MAEITLKRERPTLTVNIGDGGEKIQIPLTFNRAEFTEIGKAEDSDEAITGFFGKYLGEYFDALGDDDFQLLLRAWTDERAKLGMPDMGEPSASPDS